MEDDDNLFDESDDEPTPSTSGTGVKKVPSGVDEKKMLFRKELKTMMYGFGDDKEPFDKSLEQLEAIVLDYIKELCERAKGVGRTDTIKLEDIHYLIRRDSKKFARVKDLLSMSEELKKARKQFEDVAKVD